MQIFWLPYQEEGPAQESEDEAIKRRNFGVVSWIRPSEQTSTTLDWAHGVELLPGADLIFGIAAGQLPHEERLLCAIATASVSALPLDASRVCRKRSWIQQISYPL